MDWFNRKKGIGGSEKKAIPDGLWAKCARCGEILYHKELEKQMQVCPNCDYHFRINSKGYVKYYFDKDCFIEFNENISPLDKLKFKDTKRYSERLKSAQLKTGLKDAVITGEATVENQAVVAAIMDFTFIGGSMGSVVGEKIARAVNLALEKRVPLIIVSASGGARMMESALSLMQMAKTSAKLAQLAQQGIPYISVMTDPTTGGTTASFAMLGDINIAEPCALIGFAGQRVIKQTIGQDLPVNFQTAEFVQSHGFVDMIVHRQKMKTTLAKILRLIWVPSKVAEDNLTKSSSPKKKSSRTAKRPVSSNKI